MTTDTIQTQEIDATAPAYKKGHDMDHPLSEQFFDIIYTWGTADLWPTTPREGYDHIGLWVVYQTKTKDFWIQYYPQEGDLVLGRLLQYIKKYRPADFKDKEAFIAHYCSTDTEDVLRDVAEGKGQVQRAVLTAY